MTIEITPLMRLCGVILNGGDVGASAKELEAAYQGLKFGLVTNEIDATLKRVLGPQWNACDDSDDSDGGECSGCPECDCDELNTDGDVADALKEAYEQAETDEDVIVALSSALDIAAKYLGWENTGAVAHKIWFEA